MQTKQIKLSKDWQLILLFVLAKLLVHFFTYSNYELHRDAYLYYAESEHLSWGYFGVPPAIAFWGKLSTLLFGNTTFALRFFPAIIGCLNIIIIALAVKELKGKKTAIVLACSAYLLSPSFLHSNALFQPVTFNQFYWLLSSYLILVMINRQNPKMWIWLAVAFGLGFLHKYSISFFIMAFGMALLVSKHRYLYKSKYFLIAIGTGFLIALPNLIWQYQNNWPLISHMAELHENQLVHVELSGFIIGQIMMNTQALLIWLAGLILLLFSTKERKYRVFAFIYVFIIALLLFGSGKAYYALGIYPIMFAFGAYVIEKYIKRFVVPVATFLVASMFVSLYISFSFDGIPFVTFEQVKKEKGFRWEDGVFHDVPQDMADMTGWKEIGQEVLKVYQSLSESERENCDIFCHHYGQSGAVMFYGKKANIPHPISFNDSFVFWSPNELTKDYLIYLSDNRPQGNLDSLLGSWFAEFELKHTVDNKYFRENGTKIFLCKYPNDVIKNRYKKEMAEAKGRFR